MDVVLWLVPYFCQVLLHSLPICTCFRHVLRVGWPGLGEDEAGAAWQQLPAQASTMYTQAKVYCYHDVIKNVETKLAVAQRCARLLVEEF